MPTDEETNPVRSGNRLPAYGAGGGLLVGVVVVTAKLVLGIPLSKTPARPTEAAAVRPAAAATTSPQPPPVQFSLRGLPPREGPAGQVDLRAELSRAAEPAVLVPPFTTPADGYILPLPPWTSAGGTVAHLHLTDRDGSAALADLLRGLGPRERVAAGLDAETTGQGTCPLLIRVVNRGNVPVDFRVADLRVRLGKEAFPVAAFPHRAYLGDGTLHPGRYYEGLVTLRADAAVRDAVRFWGGRLEYADESVAATNDH